jgi:HEAT repeat protein
MLRLPYVALAAGLLAVLSLPARAADTKTETTSAAQERQRKLIEVLTSDAPAREKAIPCKQLAIYGNEDAVPALAALLPNPELSSWARVALEAIPGPAADKALRGAMSKVQGRLLVGVINSLGVRRDARAVDSLIARLAVADAEVASAAAVALGRIGGEPALKALQKALSGAPDLSVRSAAAEGCILIAERSGAEGHPAEAVKLYDAVRKADVLPERMLEATRGAILARGTAGVPLLVEQLRSNDKRRLVVGLRVARELAGREVTDALVAELGRAAPSRRGLLLLALADRGDKTVLPVVLQAAKSGPAEVRSVALGVLKRLGNVSCDAFLLEASLESDAQIAQTAMNVLAEMPGRDVDNDLAARLLKAEGKTRQILIELAGRRGIAAASAALWKAADDPDAQVRATALTALGSTVELGDLPVLIGRVVKPEKSEDTAAAQQALCSACQRMADREATAAKLVSAMGEAPAAARCGLLEILASMGGPTALSAVGAATKGSVPETRETASRLLGEWMDVDAAPVLLDLARTAEEEKYRVRAMRGYIRLVRQFVLPDDQRVQMCRTALETAARDAEKKLVLEVMRRYPSGQMLGLAIEAEKIPGLKDDATGVSLAIAQRIGGASDQVRKVMSQVAHGSMKIEILKAEYGADNKFTDVTGLLKQVVHDFPVITLPSDSYNASFGGDPAPGVVKQLKIRYRMNGKPGQISFAEDATIVLPMPKQP